MMLRRSCPAVLCALWPLVPAAAQLPPPPQQPPVIRVESNEVPVGVAVTDSRARPIKGLRREDFQVFDNGVEQPISLFAVNEDPLQVVLLVENSVADVLLLRDGKSPFLIADSLLGMLPANARVAVVTFSDQARLAAGFVSIAEARSVVRGLHVAMSGSMSGSSSMNLSESIARTIDWIAPQAGLKTIVAISTGIDTSPKGYWERVEEQIGTADVRLLAVSPFGDFRKAPKRSRMTRDQRIEWEFVSHGIRTTDEWLSRLARSTGGRSYTPEKSEDFERALLEVSRLAAVGYTLAFTPRELDGGQHTIQVKVKKSGARVHHRQAYIARPQDSSAAARIPAAVP